MNYQSIGGPKDELVKHAKIARRCEFSIVELGVLNGDTSKILAGNCDPIVTVYGIDPIIPDSCNPNLIGSIHTIEEKMSGFSNYRLINDYSFNAIKSWESGIIDASKLIDYLFIDADHKYENVKGDFESWFPWVAPGGTIGIHDSAANRGGPHWWPGPSQLSDELIKDPRVNYIETIFTLTIFKKVAKKWD